MINIGNAYLRQPQELPALNAYGRALDQPEIDQAPNLHAHTLTHIGIIRRRLGEPEAAEEMLEKALALFQQHSDVPTDQRTTLAALAGLYRDQGGLDKALEAQRLHQKDKSRDIRRLLSWYGLFDRYFLRQR